MKVLVPTPDEILTYTKQRKITWSKLQNEEYWWSSNTRFWAFTLDINNLSYFRLSINRDKYFVERKIKTENDVKSLFEYLKINLN